MSTSELQSSDLGQAHTKRGRIKVNHTKWTKMTVFTP